MNTSGFVLAGQGIGGEVDQGRPAGGQGEHPPRGLRVEHGVLLGQDASDRVLLQRQILGAALVDLAAQTAPGRGVERGAGGDRDTGLGR